MPNTYTQLLFHVVFSTKDRERTLSDDHRELLYRYVWGIHKNLNCHLYRIGGIDDHVHILTSLPTTLCLADYVKEVKTGSSRWLKERAEFPRFWRLAGRIRRVHGNVLRKRPAHRIHQRSGRTSPRGIAAR